MTRSAPQCSVISTSSMLLAALLTSAVVIPPGTAAELDFEQDILPIFRAKCIRCHAGVEPKAGLNLTSPSSLLTGGSSGAALRIGAAEFSLLYEKVSADQMPPVGQKLTAEEKGLLRKWINDGAQGVSGSRILDDSEGNSAVEHWAFLPPQRPDVPQVQQQQKVRNPVDAFVLQKLESHGLTLAPAADSLTLLRRAAFDLSGLPPDPQQVHQFSAANHDDAWTELIDQLLDSPHYGERWARHWLDVAGYAESAGILNEDRPLPLAWKYRDYVIRSFNADKPWDRFLQEQIAGDELTDYWTKYETAAELPDDVIEGIIATGFLRTAADASRPDFSTIKNASALYFYPTLFDTLQIVCSSTMGLTVQCARCHSHKFDPIPQTDYYRMQAVFTSVYRPDQWIPQMERRLLIASKQQREEADRINADADVQVKALNEQLTTLKTAAVEKLLAERQAELPEDIRAEVSTALDTAADSRTDRQKELAEKYAVRVRPEGKDLDAALAEDTDYKSKSDGLNAQVAAQQGRKRHFDEVRAAYDVPGEATAPLLLRGDPLTPGPPTPPGVLSSIAAPQPFEWTAPEGEARTSGRRLAFARWLTQPQHPLTARVMVNRIWMHHFGTGIVATPEDFGVSGDPPSHPELLDWLATEFVDSGWSVKHIHRLILNSETWRQQSRVSSSVRESAESIDPENRLLWRQSIRRLEAEPLRDAMLAVSGTLNPQMFGASQTVARQGDGEVIVPSGQDQNRRSIYVSIIRLNPETMLEIFDQPIMSVNCVQRSTSTVSTQALAMLNSDAMNRAAAAFADRVLREQPDEVVDYAVMTAFGRPVADSERQLLTTFLDDQAVRHLQQQPEAEQLQPEAEQQQPEATFVIRRKALIDLCHMLMSSNEFAYVD